MRSNAANLRAGAIALYWHAHRSMNVKQLRCRVSDTSTGQAIMLNSLVEPPSSKCSMRNAENSCGLLLVKLGKVAVTIHHAPHLNNIVHKVQNHFHRLNCKYARKVGP